MTALAARRRSAARLHRHLFGRNRLVAQQTRQANLARAITTKTSNPKTAPTHLDQTGVQKGPPFSRRRSPNRPSVIADIPISRDAVYEGIRVSALRQSEMCEYGSPNGERGALS